MSSAQIMRVLMGPSLCFQQIEVVLRFDANRQLVDEDVVGGETINQEYFEAQAD
jgi:hypothetical protein